LNPGDWLNFLIFKYYCVVDAAAKKKIASFSILMLPVITWQNGAKEKLHNKNKWTLT
jgi:hypothetical protein